MCEEPLGDVLPVNIGEIEMKEIQEACRKLNKKRASGVDEVPAEFLQTILEDDGHAVAVWMLGFCNDI